MSKLVSSEEFSYFVNNLKDKFELKKYGLDYGEDLAWITSQGVNHVCIAIEYVCLSALCDYLDFLDLVSIGPLPKGYAGHYNMLTCVFKKKG